MGDEDEVVIEASYVVRRIRGANNPMAKQLIWFAGMGLMIFAAAVFHLPIWLVALGFVVFVTCGLMAARDRPRLLEVRATPGGIRVGSDFIPRAEIRNVYRLADPPRILIQHGMTETEVPMPASDIAPFERVASLDATHKVTSMPIGAFPIMRFLMPLVGVSLVGGFVFRFMGSSVVGAWLWPVLAILAVPLVLLLVPGHADIGADGVMLRWLWIQKFIAATDIAGVEVVMKAGRPAALELRKRDGRSLTIPMLGVRRVTADTLAEQLRAIMKSAESTNVEDLLVGQSVERLRALTSRESFRAPAISPDRLWEVLENARAKPHVRIAAAVALGPTLDASGRDRMRVITEATAAPKLRVAIEAATKEEPDSAELERLLERVD